MFKAYYKKPYKADLNKLSSIVKNSLKGQERSETLELLNNVNTMRQRAIESYNIQEYNNYYTYLIPLLKHFPVTSDDKKSGLCVYWYNAFNEKKGDWYYNMTYELVSIIFNMGMYYVDSAFKLIADEANADYTGAVKNLKIATGYFKYLRETKVSGIQKIASFELTPDGLAILEKWCSSIGQFLCAKLFASKSSDAKICADLYAGAAKEFSDLVELCKVHLKDLPSKFFDEANTYYYYSAYLRDYYLYQKCLAEARVYRPGSSLAVKYCKACLESLDKALEYGRKANSKKCSEFQTFKAQVKKDYNEALSLNLRPKCSDEYSFTLESNPNVMFKVTDVPTFPEPQNLFASLISDSVKDKLNTFKMGVAEPLHTKCRTEYFNMNDAISNTFKELSVDSLVQSNLGETDISNDLWANIQLIQQSGGVESLLSRYENVNPQLVNIPALYQQLQEDFEKVMDLSDTLNQRGCKPLSYDEWKKYLNKCFEQFTAFTKNNAFYVAHMNKNYELVSMNKEIYAYTRSEQLSSYLPANAKRNDSAEFKQLETVYKALIALREERESLFATFEAGFDDTTKITSELLNDINGIDTEGIYNRGKMALEGLYNPIQMTYDTQNDLISQLKSAVNNFTALQQNNNEHQDTNPLQTINNAVAAYKDLNEVLNIVEPICKGMIVAYETTVGRIQELEKRLADLDNSGAPAVLSAPAPAPYYDPTAPAGQSINSSMAIPPNGSFVPPPVPVPPSIKSVATGYPNNQPYVNVPPTYPNNQPYANVPPAYLNNIPYGNAPSSFQSNKSIGNVPPAMNPFDNAPLNYTYVNPNNGQPIAKWQCPKCSLENVCSDTHCPVCGASRPF